MRRLLLVRHGETAWNVERRWQGQTDVPLSPAGEAQAAAVAPHLASLAPVALWSSDLTRASVTAERIGTAAGLRVGLDARLRELDLGRFEGMTMAETRAMTGVARPRWEEHGGESSVAFRARFLPALQEVVEGLDPGQTAIVVTHGAALRRGLIGFLGWPDSVESTLGSVANCGIVELTQTGGDPWRLAAYNRWMGIS